MAIISRLFASIALLGCAFLALSLPRVAEVVEDANTPPPVEIVEIMDAVQDGSIEEEAEKAAGQFALNSAGDTCLMRHRRVLHGVPRDVRQVFAAARIAENSVSNDIRANFLPEQTGMVRWRLMMQSADLALRSGDLGAAERYYLEASMLKDVPQVCSSDVSLLAARLSRSKGDYPATTQHLAQASLSDPVHFNAQFERAVHAVSRLSQGTDACIGAVKDMVDATVRMQALLSTSTQLFRLSERVSQLQTAPHNKSFMLGFVEERAGNPKAAQTLYEDGLRMIVEAQQQSKGCGPVLSAALDLSRLRVAVQMGGPTQ